VAIREKDLHRSLFVYGKGYWPNTFKQSQLGFAASKKMESSYVQGLQCVRQLLGFAHKLIVITAEHMTLCRRFKATGKILRTSILVILYRNQYHGTVSYKYAIRIL
jgi:hypothetical protein